MDRLVYFAYGSNMLGPRLAKRVPTARCEGTGFLYGHKLAFHKIGFRDRSVEGVGSGYEVMQVEITTPSGTTVSAFTYSATHIDPQLKPFLWYKQHVLFGTRQNNVPPEYIEQILSVESVKDPDRDRTLQELSI